MKLIREKSKIKNIEIYQDNIYQWAFDLYQNDIIPQGWYVHGRRGKNNLDTGNVIQLTQNWEIANSYGENGSIWLIIPKHNAKTIDFRSSKESNEFYNWLINKIGLGDFSSILEDIILSLREEIEKISDEEIKEILKINYNPKNIVDSAAAYDNYDWIEPFQYYRGGIDFVYTYDGAILLDQYSNNFIGIQVPRDEEELDYLQDKYRNKPLYESLLKESYTFREETLNFHHGQIDMELSIYEDNKYLGKIEYSLYKEIPHINMIFVDPKYRNKGIGKELIYQLAKEYGYENIEWGMMTEDGYRLQKSLDKEFKIDRDKIQNKQLPKELLKKIKNRDLYKFAIDIYECGHENAWNSWAMYDFTKENYDSMNDISDILHWIEGSKDNDHDIDEEPPDYIYDLLDKLDIKL